MRTDAWGAIRPEKAVLTDNRGYRFEVLLPENLLSLFKTMKMNSEEISSSIEGVSRRLKQILNRFEKTGINPCKNGKYGYRAKLPIRGNKVEVYVLVENNGAVRYARIVYGGGRSFCQ